MTTGGQQRCEAQRGSRARAGAGRPVHGSQTSPLLGSRLEWASEHSASHVKGTGCFVVMGSVHL